VNVPVGVVVVGLLTPLTTTVKLVPAATTVLISTVNIDELLIKQVDDIPDKVHVDVEGVSVTYEGKLM
jgi:hypothetical protein